MSDMWVVDIEASGLSPNSYPIEVAFYNGLDAYQTLIIPEESWCHWSLKSEQLHGISRKELFEQGKTAGVVAKELNTLLAAATVYSDHEDWDGFWLQRLFGAAGENQSFTVSDISELLSGEAVAIYATVLGELSSCKYHHAHRAMDDARVVHGAITKALE